MTQSRGVSASTSTSRLLPLILSFAIEPPPDPSNGFLIGHPGTQPAPRPCRNIAQAAMPCLRQFASSLKCDRLKPVTRCHGPQSLRIVGDTAAGKQLYLSTGYGGFGPDSDIPLSHRCDIKLA